MFLKSIAVNVQKLAKLLIGTKNRTLVTSFSKQSNFMRQDAQLKMNFF